MRGICRRDAVQTTISEAVCETAARYIHRVQIPPSDYHTASRLFSLPISKPAIACVPRILLSAKLSCCQSLFQPFLSSLLATHRPPWARMAAQAALIAETIVNMKRVLAGKDDCRKSSRLLKFVHIEIDLRFDTASDSDNPYNYPTSRGSKLKRKVHYLHDGDLDRPNGPKSYKRASLGYLGEFIKVKMDGALTRPNRKLSMQAMKGTSLTEIRSVLTQMEMSSTTKMSTNRQMPMQQHGIHMLKFI